MHGSEFVCVFVCVCARALLSLSVCRCVHVSRNEDYDEDVAEELKKMEENEEDLMTAMIDGVSSLVCVCVCARIKGCGRAPLPFPLCSPPHS